MLRELLNRINRVPRLDQKITSGDRYQYFSVKGEKGKGKGLNLPFPRPHQRWKVLIREVLDCLSSADFSIS
jgi:hypothetical protein